MLVVAYLKLGCKAIVTVVTPRTVLDCSNSVITGSNTTVPVYYCQPPPPPIHVLLNALQKELKIEICTPRVAIIFIRELAAVVSKWLHALEPREKIT